MIRETTARPSSREAAFFMTYSFVKQIAVGALQLRG
jgi:hypothetical protein